MKVYGVNELRKLFLEYFERNGHLKLNSYPLVPQNDKSLLLINAGMAPLKPYFTGQEIPPRNRVTTCQKCIRTNDIENVGKTARHLTFFEMLGNFSFGDYFKREAIAWCWEFLTKEIGLAEDRLYPSVYLEDDEAFDIWNKEIGIAKERIFRFGKEENFWEHGAGPCGPCSEVYYDRGERFGCGSPDCTVGCECDRYMEVWNNVFTQFNGDGQGHYEELDTKNIDTGMGLERLAVVVQDADSIFDVDTMKAIREHVCSLAQVTYQTDPKKDVSIRLITDHIRSVTFMTSDGIIPSNEGQGYVLRRLLRRAARHGRLLGISGKFLAELCKTVIAESKDGYSELEEKKEYILKVLTIEEEKFNKTIDQGLDILREMEKNVLTEKGKKILKGEDAFKLYDTYGFPLDLTKEILEEKEIFVEEEGFQKAMQVQRETAKSARKTTNYMGADATVYDEIDATVTSKFLGYEKNSMESKILVLTTETELVKEIVGGQAATIIVEQTPFYATSGGQEADSGKITGSNQAEFIVEDTIKLKGGKIGHVGVVTGGIFQVGDMVTLTIDTKKRKNICQNHSATHLLQKALRTVLGSHVEQAGSSVSEDRLRFDFTHFSAMTKEEIEAVEKLVQDQIAANLKVTTNLMSMEEAKQTGAMALFGEKYGERVRVISMGDFSVELCGGTHVQNTGVIQAFKIVSEAGIAAGVRRIEAITAGGVFEYYKSIEEQFKKAAKTAKTEPDALLKKIESWQEEIKLLQAENEKLKAKIANSSMGNAMDQVVEIKGIKVLSMKVADVDGNGLRNLADQWKEKLGEYVILFASSFQEKVNLIAMASEGAIAKGAHAGNLLKAIASLVGGGGGGKPNMAQAGGKNPAGIDQAVAEAIKVVESMLSS